MLFLWTPQYLSTTLFSCRMSNLCLDHIPLLEGTWNYRDWSKAMWYMLLGEDLWTYVSEGTNTMDLVNFSTFAPQLSPSSKSSEDVISKVRSFIRAQGKDCTWMFASVDPYEWWRMAQTCRQSLCSRGKPDQLCSAAEAMGCWLASAGAIQKTWQCSGVREVRGRWVCLVMFVASHS